MHIIKSVFFKIAIVMFFTVAASAQVTESYSWSYAADGKDLTVSVKILKDSYLYTNQTSVSVINSTGAAAAAVSEPQSHEHTDELGTAIVFEGNETHHWKYLIDPDDQYKVTAKYQGCGIPEGAAGAVCFPPAEEVFSIGRVDESISEQTTEETISKESGLSEKLLDSFEMLKVGGGLMNTEEFLAFLDVEGDASTEENSLDGKSIWLVMLLIILGGVALNLTPCVLPMIPINLAIIGAGANASSRTQGFLRGSVYGLGMTLAYGGLGIFAVLTGSKFGSLNSASWFNFILAFVFIVLALSMFGLFTIDLSRFSGRFGRISNEKRGNLIPAFVMGIVVSLMAGACVAPIAIAVLLHSATVYANGNIAGLFLPLLLGLGMALPWPVVGAGLTVLPKPGAWMIKVKYVFGFFIIILGIYYAYLGVKLLPPSAGGYSADKAVAKFEKDLINAQEVGKPVFIDFWASWCKNCLKMDNTTLKNSKVVEQLEAYTVIKFRAEKPNDPETKNLMDRYNLFGLPGYVLLRPKQRCCGE